MIIGYLLDTGMVSYYFAQHPNVVAKVNSLPKEAVIKVSAITLGEIAFGHHLTHSTDHQKREDCERFINVQFPKAQVISVTRSTRMYYGELKAKLFQKHPPKSTKENHPERCFDRVTGVELGIDENDLWIASLAIEHNLVLVTNDEMERLKSVGAPMGLTMEDWTLP